MKDKDVAKIVGKSRSYISKLRNNKLKAATAESERIAHLVALGGEDFRSIIAHPFMVQVAEVAMAKSKNTKVIRFAAMVQLISERLQLSDNS
jgi:hypothetical protein